ncbi:hypothetical protein [uncultured Maricaulis sp.]|uniref:phage head completion protein n=1 Tax=uncultured Maricaulis sp. TaxID=174710 RepID=UPI0030D7B00F|tara:strand:- start:132993 stop:133337 length:345 start_codon:yes stop_codon:yes gene_type:complete
MIGGRLIHRAEVERDQATAKDNWGGDVAPDFQPLASLRCWAWSSATREVVDGDKTAVIEDMRVMFALSADIREDDEIAAITNRRGDVIFAGRFRVDGQVEHKHTHLEAALKRIN